MPGPPPCGQTSPFCPGRQMIPRYKQHWQPGRCKGLRIVAPHMPDAWPPACVMGLLCGLWKLRGLGPGQPRAGHLGHTGTSTSSTVPTGAGRFVGLRCNITQYLHAITDASRTSERNNNNVFNAWARQGQQRRAAGTGSRKRDRGRGKRKKQVQSQRQRLQKGRQ